MKNMVKKNQIMITALAIMIAVAGYLNFAGTKITDEDMEQAEYGEIESLDSDVVLNEENYLDETMDEVMADQLAGNMENQISDGETPGEAVFTSSSGLDTLSGARLMKEQTRAKNKETLLEIINNVNIAEEQKQEAVDSMIAITDVAEKETAAEILLESKGFDDVVVSITEETVDVVVATADLTEAQRAQIEDIIIRKTGMSPEAIVISTLSSQE